MRLAHSDFLAVVAHAPLVSLDLVVRDPDGCVLVGLRTNRPAQGSWFVPGGRIYKNERVAEASCTSGTGFCWKSARAAVSSRSTSLNQSS